MGRPFDPDGPAASVDDPGNGVPLEVVDPVGDGDTDGEPDPDGVTLALGATVGLDLRTTITRPHIRQFGNGASIPWRWQ